MTDVVDSDELLRRIRRARAAAREEARAWHTRSEELTRTDPDAARDAHVRGLAYEAVLAALDTIVSPGRHGEAPHVPHAAHGSPAASARPASDSVPPP
ncbi:hypothetical protein ACFWNK_32080 [Streptomyces sp. NPDC058417]|uniref:hypothetical protein n=1 Tax=unclassified Streptomyces TaxID=2593676 RepID=UPI003662419F